MMMHDHEDSDESARNEEPSRSQRRREALDVLKLAQTLAALSDAQLARLPLDEELRAEVARTRAVTQQIARKRQTQFLAKQLRKRDDAEIEPIRAALEHDRDHARREAAALHHIETWRKRLLEEGDAGLSELLQQFPSADRQHLRQLARQARVERHENRPPHAFRELFREIRELLADGDEGAARDDADIDED